MRKKRRPVSGQLLPYQYMRPLQLAERVADEMTALADEIIKSAEEGRPAPDVGDCLRVAVDAAEWLRVMRDRSRVQASTYVPSIVKKLAERAARDGDVQAARLILDYLDFAPGKSGGVTVATQINISPQELDEMRRELEET